MNITKLNATQKMRVQVMIPDMLKLISALSNRSDAPADLKATAKGIVQGIKGDEMPWTEIAVEVVNEDVGFARPCEHPECSNWIEDPEWKYGWCEDCQDKPEPDGFYEESDRQFEVNRGN